MATQTLPEAEVTLTSKKPAIQYVYSFGGGKADGNGKMKDELGGKGAGLAEMTNAGLPVPPGFTIQTEACREYMRHGGVSKEVDREMEAALARLEQLQGQKLGKGDNPLLVSVRSGAKFSMPGMMDTILNLGLNDRERGGAGEAQQQSAFCLRFLPSPDPDVWQRRAGDSERGLRRCLRRQEETEKSQARYRPRCQSVAGSHHGIQEGGEEAHQARLPAGCPRAIGHGA